MAAAAEIVAEEIVAARRERLDVPPGHPAGNQVGPDTQFRHFETVNEVERRDCQYGRPAAPEHDLVRRKVESLCNDIDHLRVSGCKGTGRFYGSRRKQAEQCDGAPAPECLTSVHGQPFTTANSAIL